MLDPKINLLRLYLNHDTPISHSDDFNIDFSGDATIVLPDKDTVLKISYEDVTWIDSYGAPHTQQAKVEYYPRHKIAFFDTEGPQNECYCESLL